MSSAACYVCRVCLSGSYVRTSISELGVFFHFALRAEMLEDGGLHNILESG